MMNSFLVTISSLWFLASVQSSDITFHPGHQITAAVQPIELTDQFMVNQKGNDELKVLFDTYFTLKDALIKGDAKEAANQGSKMKAALDAVDMGKLEKEAHVQWMALQSDLKRDAGKIADAKDIAKQRSAFATLSANIFSLMKAAGSDEPVYYQFCPMYDNGKGGYWLSKESNIRNPYYGNMMLTCGRNIETISE